jgi:hypothetical protein
MNNNPINIEDNQLLGTLSNNFSNLPVCVYRGRKKYILPKSPKSWTSTNVYGPKPFRQCPPKSCLNA